MASIEVTGEITRVFYEGKGLEITESRQFNGETIKSRYTAWTKQPLGLTEGTTVKVTGLYSSQIDNWTNKEGEAKQSVKVSINNPTVKVIDKAPVNPADLFESEPAPF